MRALSLLLILVNVGLLGWARWVAPPQPPPAPRLVPAEAQRLVLVARAPDRVAAATDGPAQDGEGAGAAADAPAAEAGDPGPPRQAQAPAPPAELAGARLVVLAAAATAQCASIGPFEDSDVAAAAVEAVRAEGLQASRRVTEDEVFVGRAVLIPPLPTREAAQATADRLRRAGIRDMYVIEPPAPLANAISLGLFSEPARADRHAARLRSLGFAPELRDRTRTAEVYFVDFRVPPGRAVDLSRFEGGGRRLVSGACP